MHNKEFLLNCSHAVNFREIRMGNIAANTLFRSSHPIKDNKQEKVVSLLAARTNIRTIINLCDTMSGITSKSVVAPWYNRLFRGGRVIALGMDFSCASAGYRKKLKEALQFIICAESPYLIHCHAGVYRTGFVCMVIESFMGAALGDVIDDYLKSFNSIFESSIYEAKKADAATAMQILSAMSNSQIINEQNLQHIAETYLRSKINLTAEEIELLKGRLIYGKREDRL